VEEASKAKSAEQEAVVSMRTEVHCLADHLPEMRLLHSKHFSCLEESDIPNSFEGAPIYAIEQVSIYAMYSAKLGRTECVKRQPASKVVEREATVNAGLRSFLQVR